MSAKQMKRQMIMEMNENDDNIHQNNSIAVYLNKMHKSHKHCYISSDAY